MIDHRTERTETREPEAPVIDVTSLDLGGDVVFVTDRDGHIVDVNDAFVRVTGYSRQEAIGSTPRLLSSGYQDDRFYAQLWETITSGRVWEGQLVDRRRDGALRTHHATISPVFDAAGRITHFVAVERDITGELGRQVATGSAGLVHTDPTGRCVYADGRAAAILDRAPTDLLGDGFLAQLDDDDVDAMREIVSMAGDSGREHHLDVRTKAGSWLHVEVSPLSVASGAVIGAACSIEDIGDQMALHRELARRDAFVSSVLDAVPEPIAVVAADGTVLAVNAAWRQASSADGPAVLSARVGDDLRERLARSSRGDDTARRLASDLERVLTGLGDARQRAGAPSVTPLAWDEGGAVIRVPAS